MMRWSRCEASPGAATCLCWLEEPVCIFVRSNTTFPKCPPPIRGCERLRAEAEREGWPALHARLAARDPKAAARIRPHDSQRIQRALEAMELSGSTLTELHVNPRGARRLPYRLLKLALIPRERSALRERIAARFDAMLAAGFLDEVKRLQ